MPPALETARLRLRPLLGTDEADLIALDRDPEVMRYVGSPPGVKTAAETMKRAQERIQASLRGEQEPLGFWRIEGRSDRVFHGLGALLRMPEGEDIEVAYRLARRAWGQGIATEAAGALVGYAFGALALPRVVAVTYPENRASQRVLEKLGFTATGLTDYKGVRVSAYAVTARAWSLRAG